MFTSAFALKIAAIIASAVMHYGTPATVSNPVGKAFEAGIDSAYGYEAPKPSTVNVDAEQATIIMAHEVTVYGDMPKHKVELAPSSKRFVCGQSRPLQNDEVQTVKLCEWK